MEQANYAFTDNREIQRLSVGSLLRVYFAPRILAIRPFLL